MLEQNIVFSNKKSNSYFSVDSSEWAGDGQKQSDIIMKRSDKKKRKKIRTQSYKTFRYVDVILHILPRIVALITVHANIGARAYDCLNAAQAIF